MTANKRNRYLAPGVAVIVCLVTWLLASNHFQNTASRVIVEGFFYQDNLVEISRLSADGTRTPFDSFEIKGSPHRSLQKYGSYNINMPLRELEISFSPTGESQTPNSILTSVQVIKPYQNHFFFNGVNVAKYFIASEGMLNGNGALVPSAASNRVTIKSTHSIGSDNWRLVIGIPLLFFFGVLLLARNSYIRNLAAFSDMSLGNKISSSAEFDTINGLRGLAAILVLLSHTAPGFEALQMGLALLFVISGFLLAKPFVIDKHKIFSWPNVERYLTKRLKRILPMYYFYIFLIYVVSMQFDTALRHFFFVQAEGHLWPMPQIFTFYMLLPIVLIVSSLCHRIHRLLPIILLGIAIYSALVLMRGWTPYFNGRGYNEFFLFAFLIGVLASYLQYDVIANQKAFFVVKKWQREAFGLAAFVFAFFIIAWSAPLPVDIAIFKWISQFWFKCLAAALIILMALNTPNSLYRKLMTNWLLRSVGVIGFSFYILHGLGMEIFEQVQSQFLGYADAAGERSWVFVSGAFIVTYCMAILSYSLIERPFFGYREKTA